MTLLSVSLGFGLASPAHASKSPTAPLVVIERQEFVDLLSRYQFLTEERDSLLQIVDAQKAQIEAVRAESASKSQLIEQLQAQLADSQAKLSVVEKDREALEGQLKDRDFWDTVKNYAITFLLALATIAALGL